MTSYKYLAIAFYVYQICVICILGTHCPQPAQRGARPTRSQGSPSKGLGTAGY